MSKKEIFYVCASCINQKLVLETIPASLEKDAVSLYKNKYGQVPEKIEGPFYKKRVYTEPVNQNIKFNGQIKSAMYQGWKVNAFLLQEPENFAFLVFLKNIENIKESCKDTTIVPIKDLRFE
jgi:hypothetical protein